VAVNPPPPQSLHGHSVAPSYATVLLAFQYFNDFFSCLFSPRFETSAKNNSNIDAAFDYLMTTMMESDLPSAEDIDDKPGGTVVLPGLNVEDEGGAGWKWPGWSWLKC